MNKKKPAFSETIKKASLSVLGLMALNILRKLFFECDSLVELKNQFIESNQKLLIIFTFLITIILVWIIVSLIAGSIYFLIQSLKYNKTKKNE